MVRFFQLDVVLEHCVEFWLVKATFQGTAFNIINFRASIKSTLNRT